MYEAEETAKDRDVSGERWEDGETRSIGRLGTTLNDAEFIVETSPETKLLWRILPSGGEGSIRQKDVIAIIKTGSVSRIVDERSCTVEHIYDILLLEHSTVTDEDGQKAQPTPVYRSARVCNLPGAFQKRLLYGAREHLNVPYFLKGVKDLHIIISTGSGTNLAQPFYDYVLQPFLSHIGRPESSYTVHTTSSAESVTSLTKSTFLPCAQAGVEQTILLLSGDGGIADMINVILSSPLNFLPSTPNPITSSSGSIHSLSSDPQVYYRRPTIALLPFGTGNALANSLNITKDSGFGLSTLLHGTPRALPLFRATFSPGAKSILSPGLDSEPLAVSDAEGTVYGAVVCSWGFHASLVADSDTAAYRKHGAARFQIAAQEALYPSDGSEPHRYLGDVSMIKKSASGKGEYMHALGRSEHMYILATLVSNLEENLMISPTSKPLDGQLRLVHFEPLSPKEVMRVMGLAYQGGLHVNEDVVGYEDIEGIRIDFEHGEPDARWRRICVDGKIIVVGEGGWVEIKREFREVVNIVYAN